MGAIRPNATISEMGIFFKLAEGLFDGTTKSSDYPKDLSTILSNMLKVSYSYVISQNLGALTLDMIQGRVDENAKAFLSTSVAAQLALTQLDGIRKNDLPPIRKETDKIPDIKTDTAQIAGISNQVNTAVTKIGDA